ncbi:MAG: hypothetical protein AB8G22_12685 [Saprospiraceae bacterium]
MALKNHRFGPACQPPQGIFERNQQRFRSIYSDARFPFLIPVFKRLFEKDKSLTDKEILNAYYQFIDKMQSNTFAMGELEFALIAQICSYRPELTEQLLERPILSVIYSFGDEIGIDEVLLFVQHRLLKADVEPYGGLPNMEGIKWLENLPQQRALLEKVFQEVLIQVRKEMEED